MLRNPIVFLTMLILFSFLLPSCAAPPPKAIKKNANKSQVKAFDAVRKPAQAKPYRTAILLTVFSLPNVVIAGNSVPTVSHNERRSDAWLSEPWTNNDRQFASARLGIQKLVKNGFDPSALAKKYAVIAQKNPANSLLIFRWGLATDYAAHDQNIVWEPPYYRQLLLDMAAVQSPHSREFARMRFLIESRFTGETYLKKVGERLLQRDPNDTAVKIAMFPVLNVLTNPDDSNVALRYANDLIVANPRNPVAYRKLGDVYYLISIRTNTKQDSQKAIKAYQLYLKYAKPTDNYFSRINHLLDVLQKTMPT